MSADRIPAEDLTIKDVATAIEHHNLSVFSQFIAEYDRDKQKQEMKHAGAFAKHEPVTYEEVLNIAKLVGSQIKADSPIGVPPMSISFDDGCSPVKGHDGYSVESTGAGSIAIYGGNTIGDRLYLHDLPVKNPPKDCELKYERATAQF